MAYDEKAKERTMKYMKEKRDKLTLNLPLVTKSGTKLTPRVKARASRDSL